MKEKLEQFSRVREVIMKKVEAGEVTPHSKWYFAFKMLGTGIGLLLVFLLTVYLLSFSLFSMQVSGIFLLSPFGMHGIFTILTELPWLLIGLSLCGAILILSLAHSANYAYRMPLAYLFLGTIGIVGAVSAAVAVTHFHKRALDASRPLPFVRGAFVHFADPREHRITIGTLVGTIGSSSITIMTREGDTVTGTVMPQTLFLGPPIIASGSKILLVGDRTDDTVILDAVRILAPREDDDVFVGDRRHVGKGEALPGIKMQMNMPR